MHVCRKHNKATVFLNATSEKGKILRPPTLIPFLGQHRAQFYPRSYVYLIVTDQLHYINKIIFIQAVMFNPENVLHTTLSNPEEKY